MFKNGLITSILFLCSLSNVLAGSFYLGPQLNFENFRASDVRYQGLRPYLVGGYSLWVTEELYIAGELFVGPKPININNKRDDGISLKSKYSYGGSIIPGFNLDEELIAYIRLGLVSTKFESSVSTKNGKILGLGLETKVVDCWSFRGEYDYVRYSSISGVGDLKSYEFSIAAIYRFKWE